MLKDSLTVPTAWIGHSKKSQRGRIGTRSGRAGKGSGPEGWARIVEEDQNGAAKGE